MATPRSLAKKTETLPVDSQAPSTDITVEMRRRRRLAALQSIAGLWADRTDVPSDALDYQRDMRMEWR